MSTITITYQPDRDNFELHTGRTMTVLTPDEADELAYDIEQAINYRFKRRLEASTC